MNYQGDYSYKDRSVSVRYSTGWGEPGEWTMLFTDAKSEDKEQEYFVLNDADSLGSQDVGLRYCFSGNFKVVFENNWVMFGNPEDVIKVIQDYVGYDDEARALDYQRRLKIISFLKQAADKLSESTLEEDHDDIVAKVTAVQDTFEEYALELDGIDARIHVYDEIKSGHEIGAGWSNESFLRDFGDTDEVKELQKFLSNSSGS